MEDDVKYRLNQDLNTQVINKERIVNTTNNKNTDFLKKVTLALLIT